MERKSFLLAIFVLITFTAISQKYNKISAVPPLHKGQVKLQDGTLIRFQELFVKNDTVFLLDDKGNHFNYTENSIYKITKTGNNAVAGAVSCGLGGLLGAVVGTLSWTESPLKESKVTFIIGATVGCTIIGALVGLAVKKETLIYKQNISVSFYPSVEIEHLKNIQPLLTCKIHF